MTNYHQQQVAHPQQQYQQPAQQAQQPRNKALVALAERLHIDAQEVQNIVMRTLVSAKNNQQPTPEEFVTFLAIANEYKLNPLTKEIYAFSNRGTIQPIVSIDGWLSIINNHPQFDGMEFIDNLDANSNLVSVTCSIYRKDRTRPTQVTEYMDECADKSGKSEPWRRWPARMLRHKATIQAARYAFGLSGIYDPDEADRIDSVKDVTPQPAAIASDAGTVTAVQAQQIRSALLVAGKDEAYICGKAQADCIENILASKFETCINHLARFAGVQQPEAPQQQPAIEV